MTSYLLKKVPVEKESYISLGGTIILLTLFAQGYSIVRKRHKINSKYSNGDYSNKLNYEVEENLSMYIMKSKG